MTAVATTNDTDPKARAREAARRYRARMRGEAVPKLKTGRPRTFTELVETLLEDEQQPPAQPWEDLAQEGNQAAFLGRENGFTFWEVASQDTGAVRAFRLREGPETSAALHRFFIAGMAVGEVGGKGLDLAALCEQAADETQGLRSAKWTVQGSEDDWTPRMVEIGLRAACEYFRHGRFLSDEERKGKPFG
jgi:hypothetical protein